MNIGFTTYCFFGGALKQVSFRLSRLLNRRLNDILNIGDVILMVDKAAIRSPKMICCRLLNKYARHPRGQGLGEGLVHSLGTAGLAENNVENFIGKL